MIEAELSEIELKDTDCAAFKLLLKYMYTGSVSSTHLQVRDVCYHSIIFLFDLQSPMVTNLLNCLMILICRRKGGGGGGGGVMVVFVGHWP